MKPNNLNRAVVVLVLTLLAGVASQSDAKELFGMARAATTFHIDQKNPLASDTNSGTKDKPWKTVGRACREKLRPGDTIWIHDGIYREWIEFKDIHGTKDNPIVIRGDSPLKTSLRGSDIFVGKWKRASPDKVKNGLRVWVTHCNYDKISQVVVNGNRELQQIGTDPYHRAIRINKRLPSEKVSQGNGVKDLFFDSFFHDAKNRLLYVAMGGRPQWNNFEIGVRPGVLKLARCSNVTVKNLSARHSRGTYVNLIDIFQCNSIVADNIVAEQGDFGGFRFGKTQNSILKNSYLRNNGNNGFTFQRAKGCKIVDSVIQGNNTRNFRRGWHAGGTKNVGSQDCSIEGCEVAYNNGSGIWFDINCASIRIASNRIHHNNGSGIHHEISFSPTIIENNLIYGNTTRGVYISASSGVVIRNNTVIGNGDGIILHGMPRPGKGEVGLRPASPWALKDNLVEYNIIGLNGTEWGRPQLLIAQNYMVKKAEKLIENNASDYNLILSEQEVVWPDWGQSWTISEWREKTGNDRHSLITSINPGYHYDLHGRFVWDNKKEIALLSEKVEKRQDGTSIGCSDSVYRLTF